MALLILVYLEKLFKFCLPNDKIIWSGPNHQSSFICLALKLVVLALVPTEFDYSLVNVVLVIVITLQVINSFINYSFLIVFNENLEKVKQFFNYLQLLIYS